MNDHDHDLTSSQAVWTMFVIFLISGLLLFLFLWLAYPH